MTFPPRFAGYPPRDYAGFLAQEMTLGGPDWKPAYTRVWREGRDVTDEDPSTWPWPWNPEKGPKRG